MTKEDKKLLLQDLCARLPYVVKLFKVNEPESAFELYSIDKESGEIKYYKYRGKSLEIGDMGRLFRTNDIPRFKPYLRPMSSMSEEEKNYISEKCGFSIAGPIRNECELIMPVLAADWLIDFYNERHFDYRGLIEKGLAIEAPKDMYNIN